MKMLNRQCGRNSHPGRTFFVILITLTALLLAGCSSKPSAEDIAKGKELTYSRCTTCHSSENFEHHRYSRAEWQSIIQRMMKHGAQYTPEEQGLIADFLSTQFGK